VSTLDLEALTDRELHAYLRARCVELAGRLGVSTSAADLGGLALADEAYRLNALVGQK
jgi:predicted metalloendopeptidase